MRCIGSKPLNYTLSSAGIDRQKILEISLRLPLDNQQLLLGKTLLESIDKAILPDLAAFREALIQELTEDETFAIGLHIKATTESRGTQLVKWKEFLEWMRTEDSALKGLIHPTIIQSDSGNGGIVLSGEINYEPII